MCLSALAEVHLHDRVLRIKYYQRTSNELHVQTWSIIYQKTICQITSTKQNICYIQKNRHNLTSVPLQSYKTQSYRQAAHRVFVSQTSKQRKCSATKHNLHICKRSYLNDTKLTFDVSPLLYKPIRECSSNRPEVFVSFTQDTCLANWLQDWWVMEH